jgi:hypothetical protein
MKPVKKASAPVLAALALALCALTPEGRAQNAITQEGTVLKDSPMMFRGNNRARQGATVKGAPTGQTVTTGDSVVGGRCDYSAPVDSPNGYYFICIDAKTGKITSGGTATPPHGLTFEVDGAVIPFPVPGTITVVTPTMYGAKGDGIVDDTTSVQAAINAGATLGVPVQFDAAHLYKITAPLIIDKPVQLEGPYRYGIWPVNNPTGGLPQKCPWGLVTPNTGITMIQASAITGTIRGVCIDMTGDALVQATAGTAINFAPPSAAMFQSGWHVELNTILNPYLGIGMNGAGWSPDCCGKGTIADGVAVLRNTIVNPRYAAIEVGKNTAWAASVGIVVHDNNIVCGKSDLVRGKGLVIHDGGVDYDGSNNGPVGCDVGVEIVPGYVSGQPQWVQFGGDGVLGDQSITYDFWMHPLDGGWVSPVRIGGKHPWANQVQNGGSVLIDCTATTQSFCDGVTITNLISFGGSDQNVPIVEVRGGAGGPFNFSLTNSNIRQGGSGAVPGGGAIGLKLSMGAGSNYAGNWNITGNVIGGTSLGCCTAPNTVMPVALSLDTSASTSTSSGAINISGNNFSNHLNLPNKPIDLNIKTDGSDRIIIRNNIGVEDAGLRPLTAAATVSLDEAYPNYVVTGTTPISTINGAWAGRSIQLSGAATNTLNLAIGGNICAPAVVNGNATLLTWPFGSSCWQHVP